MQLRIGGKPCEAHAKTGVLQFPDGTVVRFQEPLDLARFLLTVQPSKRDLWVLGCEYDNIDPDDIFVNWTDDNPYAGPYDKLMGLYLDSMEDTDDN